MTAAVASLILASPGTRYSPGDSIVLAGGAGRPAALVVTSTQAAQIGVVAGGSGGTDGEQLIAGTTGAGQLFTGVATVLGGVMQRALIVTPGTYTTGPAGVPFPEYIVGVTGIGSSPLSGYQFAEPVTGGGLAGAVVSLNMGVLGVLVIDPGAYTALPPNPVLQSAASGAGQDAAWTMTWAGLTSAQFRVNFPGFMDALANSDDQINFWLSIAAALLPADRLGSMYWLATQYFIAHNLSVEQIATAGGLNGGPAGISRGPVSSESGPAVSVSYDTSSGLPENAGHWALTTYGTRLLDMIRRRGAGPMQVGVGYTPPNIGSLSTGAWPGPPVFVPAWFST